jgi:hypothetical protein
MNALTAFAELYAREAEYWYEVDHNAGSSAHLLYAEDGIFVIGDKVLTVARRSAGFIAGVQVSVRERPAT